MSFTTEILSPNSFHPISKNSFDLTSFATEIISGNCTIHLFYQLPPSLFVDPYELAQRHESYTFAQWGHVDLEKPVHAVPNSDTDILVNVHSPYVSPTDTNEKIQLSVEVPLHARYGVPIPGNSFSVNNGNYHNIVLNVPEAFIACPNDAPAATGQDQEQSIPPRYLSEAQLEQVNLASTMTFFKPISLSSSAGPHLLRIPVGHGGDLFAVQCGTALIILGLFSWVLFAAIQTAIRLRSGCLTTPRKVD